MPKAFQPGDVIVVTMPFTGGSGVKTRTAVVLIDPGDDDVVVVPMTSQGARTEFDIEVTDLQRAHLNEMSWVRGDKPQTVGKNLVSKRVGQLATPDKQQVIAAVKKFWALLP